MGTTPLTRERCVLSRSILVHAAAALALSCLASLLPATASAIPVEGMEWKWEPDTTHSWYIENAVLLPTMIWVMKDQNKEARLVYWDTQLVMECGNAEVASKKAWEVNCVINDFSIRGAPMSGDQGLLQPILEEMDDKLTGSVLQIVIRKDGRVTNIDLEGVDKTNRRTSQMQETMRIILARAIAGIDLQLPRKGASAEGVWGQFQSNIMAAPTDRGSQGAAEMAHLVHSIDDDYVIIETAGRGMISPANDESMTSNYFETELESVSVFDLDKKILRERVWSAVGTPTASSAVSEGREAIPYGQKGKLLYLGDGVDAPQMMPTAEIVPPEDEPTSVGEWSPLNSEAPR